MTTTFDRGRLLRRAALAIGGAAGIAGLLDVTSGTAAAELDTVVLISDGCAHGPSCTACNACVRHAANSLFPSAAAADANRAHPHCTCTVASGPSLPADSWRALFGDPAAPIRARVDRRATWVAETLAAAAVPVAPTIVTLPAPTPPAPPAPEPEAVPAATPPTASPSAAASQAALRCRIEVTRPAGKGAPLGLHVLADRACTLDARLLARDGRRVAGGYWKAPEGASTHAMRLRKGISPGTYRLRVRATDGRAVRTIERRVTL